MTRTRFLFTFIFIVGFILRLAVLNDPVSYDEAYTYVGFASHSLWAALSDYSLPNNHVFHTILAWFSVSFFENQPWILRLPALLAGLASIPLAYWVGHRLYSPQTGLLTAALVAWFPEMVNYSTEARGYSLLAALTLLSILLSYELTQGDRWWKWALLALTTALGFFTLPLMLYPAGGIYLWLALEGPKNRAYFTRWLASGLAAGVLTVLLYVPALLVSGWRRILANGFVQPVAAAKYFDWVLVTRLKDTWSAWTGELPLALTGLLVLGFVLALVLHWRIQPTRWPLSLVLLVWIAALVLTRRPEAFDRFWSWLIAPALLWAAAGLVETAKKARVRRVGGETVLIGLAVAGLCFQAALSLPKIPQNWQKVGNQEAAAIFLAENLAPGEVVLAGYPNNPQVWYYLGRRGVAETAWQPRPNAPAYWLLLATNQKDETLASIVKEYKLDPAALDLDEALLAQKYGKIEIYRAQPKR